MAKDPVYTELVSFFNVLQKVLQLLKADDTKLVLLKHNFKHIYGSLSKKDVVSDKEELLSDFIKEKNAGVEMNESSEPSDENIYVSQIRDIFYFQAKGEMKIIDYELNKIVEGFSLNVILNKLNKFIQNHQ